MPDRRQSAWWPIRALRAMPPDFANAESRRGTFVAALEQAEQLWTSADLIGASASPLPLFYAIEQAGLAILQTRDKEDNPPRVHGLSFPPPVGEGSTQQLDGCLVKPSRRGTVQRVAAVLGSPVIGRQVSLAEIIASYPGHELFDDSLAPGMRPLIVADTRHGPDKCSIGPVPDELVPDIVRIGGQHMAPTEWGQEELQPFVSWLAKYPRLAALGQPADHAGWFIPIRESGDPPARFRIILSWPNALPMDREESENPWDIPDPESSSPWSFNFTEGLSIPAIGDNDDSLHPLISWWLVLFALSNLARYHPATWTAMLAVDQSDLAVPLERLLQSALDSVPPLILGALTGG